VQGWSSQFAIIVYIRAMRPAVVEIAPGAREITLRNNRVRLAR
jgi:hypothetical protein